MLSLNMRRAVLKQFRRDIKFLALRGFSRQINPAIKTWNVLAKEIPVQFGGKKGEITYPEHADVVIIGGGFIGSASAYWLKSRAVHGLNVVVLEKDMSFPNVQENISLGTLTQHFSLEENIKLSQFSAEFLRNLKSNLEIDVDIKYNPIGSLVLASEKFSDKLEHNASLLKEENQRINLLTPAQIKEQYPWLNTNDIKLGCIGYESEGTFNSWALLQAYLRKSSQLGVQYVNAEVCGFEMENQRDVLMEGVAPGSYQRINKVVYRTPDGEERSVKFAACILAAGENSSSVAQLANVGSGEGLLSVPLPVEKRKYKMYTMENNVTNLGLGTPMVTDTTGLWFRRNGIDNNVLFSMIPLAGDSKNYTEDAYYKDVVLASLFNRIPESQNSKIKCIGTETIDSSTYDDTGIIGVHPYYNNLILATGFGRHGCQHSPGIGRAIAELVIDSRFLTIDFTRYGFDRFLMSQPLVEFNVY